ncbi:MAG: hypothetical protein LBO78_01645 [Rickettsiales bacterium]|jgi:hypothetical protein|nr:hypothetical protein [Rickettsiales bacterium]
MSEEDRRKIAEAAREFALPFTAAKAMPGYIDAFEELVRRYNGRKNLLNG